MRTTLALTVALTIVGAAFSPVTAMAQQTPKQGPSNPPPPANQIDSARTQPDDKSLTEFWTPERLRSARPMPTPRVEPEEIKK